MAEAGWQLLPYYRFSVDSGLWRHRDYQCSRELGLDDLSFESGQLEYRGRQLTEPESALARYLEHARQIIAEAKVEFGGDEKSVVLPEGLERLRWFPLPNAPFIEGLSTKKDSDGVDP